MTLGRRVEEALCDGATKHPMTARKLRALADWLPSHALLVGELLIPVLQDWLRRRAQAASR